MGDSPIWFVYQNQVFDQKANIKQYTLFKNCLFSDITTSTDYSCAIYVSVQNMRLLIRRTIFKRLRCLTETEYSAGAVYVRNCNDAKMVSSCFEDTRQLRGSQSYGLDSFNFNLLSAEVNMTYYFEGDEPHTCGSLSSPFFAGGREHFLYSNNNVSCHKECEMFRFILFTNLPSGVETVSFSQFDTFKGNYLFDPHGAGIEQAHSHLNVLNITATTSFTRSGSHVSRNVYMSSCVFSDIDPVTSPGSVTVHFTSSTFSFPKSNLPSSYSFDSLCKFECSNLTTNRVVMRYKWKCAISHQFTYSTDSISLVVFIFHQILSKT